MTQPTEVEPGSVEASGKWGKLNVPAAVAMALLTAVSSTVATRCNGPEAAVRALEHTQRQQYDALDTRLRAIEADQRALVQTLQRDTSKAATDGELAKLRLEALERRLDRLETAAR